MTLDYFENTARQVVRANSNAFKYAKRLLTDEDTVDTAYLANEDYPQYMKAMDYTDNTVEVLEHLGLVKDVDFLVLNKSAKNHKSDNYIQITPKGKRKRITKRSMIMPPKPIPQVDIDLPTTIYDTSIQIDYHIYEKDFYDSCDLMYRGSATRSYIDSISIYCPICNKQVNIDMAYLWDGLIVSFLKMLPDVNTYTQQQVESEMSFTHTVSGKDNVWLNLFLFHYIEMKGYQMYTDRIGSFAAVIYRFYMEAFNGLAKVAPNIIMKLEDTDLLNSFYDFFPHIYTKTKEKIQKDKEDIVLLAKGCKQALAASSYNRRARQTA